MRRFPDMTVDLVAMADFGQSPIAAHAAPVVCHRIVDSPLPIITGWRTMPMRATMQPRGIAD